MANPTSNFGWQMPTSTDLVTDLPADFETFGQAVDTSMADLKGGTTGQILAKATNADMDFTWITNDVGDITAVTAGSGLSGGGTSGAVTVSLDLTSANVFSAAQTATSFIVTGATVPTNGMYLSAANTLAFSTNSTSRLTISTTGISSSIASVNFANGATGSASFEMGAGRSVDGSTFIDLIGDTTYTDYGTRFIRNPGANGLTQIYSRGTGGIRLTSQDAGEISFQTTATTRMSVSSTGRIGLGTSLASTAQTGVFNVQGTGDLTLLTRNFAAQTADSVAVQNSASSLVWGVTAAGFMKYISGNTATTVGAAGGASALPATPTGYLKIDIGGTEFKVPYYAA